MICRVRSLAFLSLLTALAGLNSGCGSDDGKNKKKNPVSEEIKNVKNSLSLESFRGAALLFSTLIDETRLRLTSGISTSVPRSPQPITSTATPSGGVADGNPAEVLSCSLTPASPESGSMISGGLLLKRSCVYPAAGSSTPACNLLTPQAGGGFVESEIGFEPITCDEQDKCVLRLRSIQVGTFVRSQCTSAGVSTVTATPAPTTPPGVSPPVAAVPPVPHVPFSAADLGLERNATSLAGTEAGSTAMLALAKLVATAGDQDCAQITEAIDQIATTYTDLGMKLVSSVGVIDPLEVGARFSLLASTTVKEAVQATRVEKSQHAIEYALTMKPVMEEIEPELNQDAADYRGTLFGGGNQDKVYIGLSQTADFRWQRSSTGGLPPAGSQPLTPSPTVDLPSKKVTGSEFLLVSDLKNRSVKLSTEGEINFEVQDQPERWTIQISATTEVNAGDLPSLTRRATVTTLKKGEKGLLQTKTTSFVGSVRRLDPATLEVHFDIARGKTASLDFRLVRTESAGCRAFGLTNTFAEK